MNPPPSQPPPPRTAGNVLQSHHQHPPPPPPLPSLPDALSNLSSLLQLSATVLHSLPTIPTASKLLPCPFNPNHRVPPSSLFSHYLNCPSPLPLSHTFHYPHTLLSSSTNSPAIHIPTDSSDLTVSTENYIGYGAPETNFFYQNCPGPVTPSTQSPLLLNIPRILYVECTDFSNDSTLVKSVGLSVDFIKFLPSEIWAIRSEIEAWGGGFPSVYSARILRAILRLRDCKLLHLCEWIVSNSPRYGVIIDFAMRDHMVLLVNLCLKVILSESLVKFSNDEMKTEEISLVGLGNKNFECPVLVKVMMWLALQFSILFGEVNGKFFAVDVLRECISDSALQASLFPLERSNDIPVEDSKRETVGSSMVSIGQVVAAVAALRERSLIEDKIKALRNSWPVPAYQRNMDHEYICKIADEERKKRPDYRPVIEHDGFLWQRSSNQDTNRVKTREELLAEERDYKRRRMSYRGKKLKRNTLEVTRAIIEEYMEEIKLAGGIGDMSKAVETTKFVTSENLNKKSSDTGVSVSRTNYEFPEEKNLHSHHDSEKFKDDNGRQDLNGDVGRIRHDRDDYTSSRDGRNSRREHIHGIENRDSFEASGEGSLLRSRHRRDESHEENYIKRNRDEHGRNNYKRERQENEKTSHKRDKYEDSWELKHRGKRKTDSSYRGRDEDNNGQADRRRSKMNRSSSSRAEPHKFEDRYNPAESD